MPGTPHFFDLSDPANGMNYRWVQPPQIAYLVTTVDARGNVNATPVTLGTCVSVDMEPEKVGNTFYTFALGSTSLPHVPARHGHLNLQEVPECVISYLGAHLFEESHVAALPLPRGISEIDVAGLTPLPSQKVRPPGVLEAKVNIECRVVSSMPIGAYYHLYVCQAVGVSVDRDLLEEDGRNPWHAGVFALDPLYELTVLPQPGLAPRLYYVQLDKESVRRMPDVPGPSRTWVGSFEGWMEDEERRGSLSAEERERIMALDRAWQANPDPEKNGDAKEELTAALRDLVEREKEARGA